MFIDHLLRASLCSWYSQYINEKFKANSILIEFALSWALSESGPMVQ